MPIPSRKPGRKDRFRHEFTVQGTETSLPDTDTEISHGLGTEPTEVRLEPLSTGVEGYAMETERSATSITLRANVSGVNVNWSAQA